jgi:hypothetical protein
MLTVRFEDRSEEFLERLRRKLLAAVSAGARTLSERYVERLTETIAPPHSRMGQIPHAYLGWTPGGFGPVNRTTLINNEGQIAFLATYIDFTVGDSGSDLSSSIGFKPSHADGEYRIHTAGSDGNYLLWHNSNGRPWVGPIFDENRDQMANQALAAFEATQ